MTNNNRITAGGYASGGQSTIILQNINRFNLDIHTYMQALQAADRIDWPMRARLYDLLEDVMLDGHWTSVSNKRKGGVLRKPIEFVRDGVRDERVMEQIESPWFYRYINDLLGTIDWGESLYQFWLDERGWVQYYMVPRKHFDSSRRIILQMQNSITGQSWDNFSNLLHVSHTERLGLLAKAAPYIIYKRNDISDWAQFCEVFGMPIREYTYDSEDEEARDQVYRDAFAQGASAIFIHPKGSDLAFRESNNKTGSADLYHSFANFLNGEISKIYLGNTLTTESGGTGSRALGDIHSEEEDKLLDADDKFLLSVLNYDMTDVLANLGINTRGGKFQYVTSKKVDLKVMLEVVDKLYNMGLPIDEDWCYETFGVRKPVGSTGNLARQIPLALPAADPTPKAPDGPDLKEDLNGGQSSIKDRSIVNRMIDFFGSALRLKGADHLSW